MRHLLVLALLVGCRSKESGGDTAAPVDPDPDGDGVIGASDCDESDPALHAGAEETCDGVDSDCDGVIDDDPVDGKVFFPDVDGDGHGDALGYTVACAAPADHVDAGDDCDDTDEDVHPAATESCGELRDLDCDGAVPFTDTDGDGSPDCEDCAPSDRDVYPGAPEQCDEVSNDCDAEVDEDAAGIVWFADLDDDGHGDPDATIEACARPAGYAATDDDCDDADADVHPGAGETCDGVDEDCSGDLDEDATDRTDWYADVDGDGVGSSATRVSACASPGAAWLQTSGDCDDARASIHPSALEVCDGVDQDCDGTADEGLPTAVAYADEDRDGFGDLAAPTVASCAPPAGAVSNSGDCDDDEPGIRPTAAETCDGVDQDCDGTKDEGVPTASYFTDADGDGHGDATATPTVACAQPAGTTTVGDDCNDKSPAVHPGATDVCNGVDDDCDTVTDAADAVDTKTWYRDADKDGSGALLVTTKSCTQPGGYVANGDDCDDAQASVVAGTEACPHRVGGTSCKAVRDAGNAKGDGVYEVNWGAGAKNVYCDQTTDGGGWTALVNPSAMTQRTIEGLTTRRTVQSGGGSTGCDGLAPAAEAPSNGWWTMRGYACGTYTNLWEIDWTNPIGATQIRFTAAVQGQQTRTFVLNGATLAPSLYVDAYMRCAYYNAPGAGGNPGTNACWSTTLDVPPRVVSMSGPLAIDITTGQGCSPDCSHGTAFNLQKVMAR